MRAFIAGPLTDAEDRRIALYEAIGDACRELGCEVFLPHLDTEAVDEPADEQLVFRQDFEGLSRSDFVIAEVSRPSHGVGAELMQAFLQDKPVVCLLHQGAGVSRMVSGNPAVRTILRYGESQEAVAKVRKYLANCPWGPRSGSGTPPG